jgi:uncharacterized FAD-dependent dehydrogenase
LDSKPLLSFIFLKTKVSQAKMEGIQTIDIQLPLDQSTERDQWHLEAARALGLSSDLITEVRIIKRSIDARQRTIKVQLRLEVGIQSPLPVKEHPSPPYHTLPPHVPKVIIVGSGPAGLFGALRFIELGWRPIVLERGKDVSARRFDLAPILRHGKVIEDSNYCFGEGGAGTFSDGKLYTRAKKRGPVSDVYRTLVAHGAPEEILIDAHPHIGSNLLPNVVRAMRQSILQAGGEVHFKSKVTDFLIQDTQIRGVIVNDRDTFEANHVILATGHSARDIYQILHTKNLLLESKPFAVGVRIEHPQPLIDRYQYHLREEEPRPLLLPAASYRLATKIRDRGVHSFCMCPGGFIVPAATENDEVVVNGMSLSRRDSPYANSGMVVTVEPEDTGKFSSEFGPLAGIAYQKVLEQAAKHAGGGGQVAPAQRVTDFLQNRCSQDLPKTSYHPGIRSTPLLEFLPADISGRLKEGLQQFGKQMRGYIAEEACLIGFETRTSSPVRIPREPSSLQHPQVKGLYPCGEGAGFAGGIVSAALDGIRCAEAAAAAK